MLHGLRIEISIAQPYLNGLFQSYFSATNRCQWSFNYDVKRLQNILNNKYLRMLEFEL
jgi:hypothetical protein